MAMVPLAKSGGGDDHGGMDLRLTRLEEDMREVKTDLKALRSDVAELKGRMTGLEGRMSGVEARLSQLPTTWQVFTFMISMMAGMFAILRFGLPH